MKNRKLKALLIILIIFLISSSSTFNELGILNSLLSTLKSLTITTILMIFVPGMLRIINEAEFEYKKGKKICFINSLCISLLIAFTDIYPIINELAYIDELPTSMIFNMIINIVSTVIIVFLYYFINMLLFVNPHKKTVNSQTNTVEDEEINLLINSYKKVKCDVCEEYFNQSVLIRGMCPECYAEVQKGLKEESKNNNTKSLENENFQPTGTRTNLEETRLPHNESSTSSITKNISKPSEKKVIKTNKKSKKIIILIILIIILVLIIIGLVSAIIYMYITNKSYLDDLDYSNKKIKHLRAENLNYENTIEKYKKNTEEYKEKADYLDKNVVFVLDGYGMYYYTYDQMRQVTQGVREFSYWIYNKEAAIFEGYTAWK